MANQNSNVSQIEGPKGEQTNLRLRSDLKRRAEHICVDLKIPLHAFINEALESHLNKTEAELEKSNVK